MYCHEVKAVADLAIRPISISPWKREAEQFFKNNSKMFREFFEDTRRAIVSFCLGIRSDASYKLMLKPGSRRQASEPRPNSDRDGGQAWHV